MSGYNPIVATGDRATLGSDLSTIAMLYSMASIEKMLALLFTGFVCTELSV
jgi:hypothetical protein